MLVLGYRQWTEIDLSEQHQIGFALYLLNQPSIALQQVKRRVRTMYRVLNTAVEQNGEVDRFPLVSVIIPAYNAAAFINETVDSVISQTYTNYEVIVVNDGSPDTADLESALARYGDRVIYITQENRGPAAARNTGIRIARGSLIASLDADDIWLSNYLEVQVGFLNEHPGYDLVYCNARFFGESVHSGKEYMAVCPSDGDATASAIISRRCHVFGLITARKEALSAVGFDESLRSSEDFDCWIRFAAAGYSIGYHREVLVRYRKHRASLSSKLTAMAEYNLYVLNKHLSRWAADSEEASSLRHAKAAKTAELETMKGKLALQGREFIAARNHFQAANSYYRSTKFATLITLIRIWPSFVSLSYRLRQIMIRSYRVR